MRFHKIANVNKALQFIESKGVKLVSIGAEGKNCGCERAAGFLLVRVGVSMGLLALVFDSGFCNMFATKWDPEKVRVALEQETCSSTFACKRRTETLRMRTQAATVHWGHPAIVLRIFWNPLHLYHTRDCADGNRNGCFDSSASESVLKNWRLASCPWEEIQWTKRKRKGKAAPVTQISCKSTICNDLVVPCSVLRSTNRTPTPVQQSRFGRSGLGKNSGSESHLFQENRHNLDLYRGRGYRHPLTKPWSLPTKVCTSVVVWNHGGACVWSHQPPQSVSSKVKYIIPWCAQIKSVEGQIPLMDVSHCFSLPCLFWQCLQNICEIRAFPERPVRQCRESHLVSPTGIRACFLNRPDGVHGRTNPIFHLKIQIYVLGEAVVCRAQCHSAGKIVPTNGASTCWAEVVKLGNWRSQKCSPSVSLLVECVLG